MKPMIIADDYDRQPKHLRKRIPTLKDRSSTPEKSTAVVTSKDLLEMDDLHVTVASLPFQEENSKTYSSVPLLVTAALRELSAALVLALHFEGNRRDVLGSEGSDVSHGHKKRKDGNGLS
ncbi:hypothetical protein QR680_000123 [Steinernema hermaphroditum]|uniref:Uncharacterized protein n=1 Tax=Steinernema hermaphroditum TaxID=289476 RepID=A0AA39LDR3_9BILA|nr:hypothetical protein QR680_000123 [Steinernema hermaphroditum]